MEMETDVDMCNCDKERICHERKREKKKRLTKQVLTIITHQNNEIKFRVNWNNRTIFTCFCSIDGRLIHYEYEHRCERKQTSIRFSLLSERRR